MSLGFIEHAVFGGYAVFFPYVVADEATNGKSADTLNPPLRFWNCKYISFMDL